VVKRKKTNRGEPPKGVRTTKKKKKKVNRDFVRIRTEGRVGEGGKKREKETAYAAIKKRNPERNEKNKTRKVN